MAVASLIAASALRYGLLVGAQFAAALECEPATTVDLAHEPHAATCRVASLLAGRSRDDAHSLGRLVVAEPDRYDMGRSVRALRCQGGQVADRDELDHL